MIVHHLQAERLRNRIVHVLHWHPVALVETLAVRLCEDEGGDQRQLRVVQVILEQFAKQAKYLVHHCILQRPSDVYVANIDISRKIVIVRL